MGNLYIRGGIPLAGEVSIQGSKNAALPLLTASLLIGGKTILHNCPRIKDIEAMAELLETLGCGISFEKNTIIIDAAQICDTHCPQKQVQAMRSSIMLLGPMLGRCKQIRMNRPGGCVIGQRPIDIHEKALRQMNVCFDSDEELITAHTDRLRGAEICLPFPSVGATENVVMAAVLADGITHLKNAAKEPEVQMLCMFLNKAGARIKGIGESEIEIRGVSRLHGVEMRVIPDRIVAGTYLLAGVATRGQIILRNAPCGQLKSVIEVLRRMGACVIADDDILYLDAEEATKPIEYIRTEVYPGFPTDLQSVLLAALATAQGESVVEETIFEDRFKIIPELRKMGADIFSDNRIVHVRGVSKLSGTAMQACELRGGAALVVAALAAKGESVITGGHFIERGYENICRDLQKLSAEILWKEKDRR